MDPHRTVADWQRCGVQIRGRITSGLFQLQEYLEVRIFRCCWKSTWRSGPIVSCPYNILGRDVQSRPDQSSCRHGLSISTVPNGTQYPYRQSHWKDGGQRVKEYSLHGMKEASTTVAGSKTSIEHLPPLPTILSKILSDFEWHKNPRRIPQSHRTQSHHNCQKNFISLGHYSIADTNLHKRCARWCNCSPQSVSLSCHKNQRLS